MVRITFALAGSPAVGSPPVTLELRAIDIFKNAHLDEFYLRHVNPKGQVPALTSPGFLERPITDSLDITFFACDRYPSLRPAEHSGEIDRLLRELHAINFFSLSFNTRPQLATQFEEGVEEKLMRSDISPEYRSALEYKLRIIKSEKIDGVRPEVVNAEVERAKAYLDQLEGIKKASGGDKLGSPWIFGGQEPTALDTSLIVFLVRMQDVGRQDLIPPGLLHFTQVAGATKEFRNVYASLPSE